MRIARWIAVTAVVALAAVIVPERAAAQTINFIAGPVLANISTDDPDFESSDVKVGFFGAVGTSIQAGQSLFVSPYVAYVQKGAKFSDVDATLSYDYIEIPVFLGLRFPVGESVSGSVFAGPQVGFQINVMRTASTASDVDGRKSTEFGVAGGVGLRIPGRRDGGAGRQRRRRLRPHGPVRYGRRELQDPHVFPVDRLLGHRRREVGRGRARGRARGARGSRLVAFVHPSAASAAGRWGRADAWTRMGK